MSKAKEFRQITNNYENSEIFLRKVNTLKDKILNIAENMAKNGKSDYHISEEFTCFNYFPSVVKELKKEEFTIYYDEYVDEWIMAW